MLSCFHLGYQSKGIGCRLSRARKNFKYSDVQSQIDELVSDATQHVNGADRILNKSDLWAAPRPFCAPIESHAVRPHPLGESLSWACSQTLRLHRMCNKCLEMKYGGCAVLFLRGSMLVQSWLVASSHRLTEMMARVVLDKQTGLAVGDTVHYARPQEIMQSVIVFDSFYQAHGRDFTLG